MTSSGDEVGVAPAIGSCETAAVCTTTPSTPSAARRSDELRRSARSSRRPAPRGLREDLDEVEAAQVGERADVDSCVSVPSFVDRA